MLQSVTLLNFRLPGDGHVYVSGWFILLLILIISSGLGYLIYTAWYRKKYWENGVFPPNLKCTRNNLMEAYIASAAVVVLQHREQMVSKMGYINVYFQRHFRDVYYDFMDSYRNSLVRPVSVESIAFWANKHLGEKDRKEWMKFLVGLAFYSGMVNRREYAILLEFGEELKLNIPELEALIEGSIKREQQKKRSTKTGKFAETLEKNREEKMAAVFDLTIPCSMEAVKKSYRKLVMTYHPDKFQNASEPDKQGAVIKFMEIREAYEYFEQTWK